MPATHSHTLPTILNKPYALGGKAVTATVREKGDGENSLEGYGSRIYLGRVRDIHPAGGWTSSSYSYLPKYSSAEEKSARCILHRPMDKTAQTKVDYLISQTI